MLLHYMCRNLCKNQISTLWSLFAKPKTSRLMWQIFLNIVRALNVVFHSDFISLYSCLATLRILQLRSLCTAYWARWLCKTMMCNGINSLNSDNVTNHFGLSSNMKMSTALSMLIHFLGCTIKSPKTKTIYEINWIQLAWKVGENISSLQKKKNTPIQWVNGRYNKKIIH